MEELSKDLAELECLEKQATRQRIKNILCVEMRKLQTEVLKLQEQQTSASLNTNNTAASSSKRYEVKLNNYAWDQSSKFVKFYVTLPKVQHVAQENVSCTFTEKSLVLNVGDLDNKDYVFTIKNLLNPIIPHESNWKIKTDMILINAAKTQPVTWAYITETEKRAHDSRKMHTPDAGKVDPTEGLMSVMKNIYEQADDGTKRIMAQAWHESQTKGPAI